MYVHVHVYITCLVHMCVVRIYLKSVVVLFQCGEFRDAAHLVLPHVPAPSLDHTSEGQTWRRLADEDSVSCVCLFLTGTALVCIYMCMSVHVCT